MARRPAGGTPIRPPRRDPGGPDAPLPSKEALRRFLQASPGKVGKTEISRHFGLSSDQRPALRALLAEMKADGTAAPAGRRGLSAPGRLPDMAVIEVTGTDPDGDPIARPLGWKPEQGRPPIIFMRPERAGQPALAPGERVLARLKSIGAGKYEGTTVKRVGSAAIGRVLGVYENGRIVPTDRRHKAEWVVPPGEAGGATNGQIVLAEPLPGRDLGLRPARVVEVLGRMGRRSRSPSSASMPMASRTASPPRRCGRPNRRPASPPPAARICARFRSSPSMARMRATLTTRSGRRRTAPVGASSSPSPTSRITSAPGAALDREAWARGNSVYFPDRVVPMLPEALSNGWCSLRPGEDRGCLFVEMRFDSGGTKSAYRFGRGIMRSAARLTYEQAQAAQDAGEDPTGTLVPLYGAYRALLAARERRGTLELDLPERRVRLDEAGTVLGVEPRARLDSHRLIEEFMVAANVCAAEELERLSQPCMYRVHDRPSDQKLEGLRQFLDAFDITLPQGDRIHPRDFAHALALVADRPEARLVHETVLRSQSQAAYAPENIGHFGLALGRYAHFTSPIRRYADLLVHRALVRGLKLGDDGLPETEAARFPDTGEHITQTERRAAAAERDAVDRYLAAYMSQRVGEMFDARISGVTRFGLFVTVEANGASGIVPLASLPDDRWIEDQARHVLSGQRTGLSFALGQAVEARLVEATPRTGGMVFHLMQGIPTTRPKPARGARRRS